MESVTLDSNVSLQIPHLRLRMLKHCLVHFLLLKKAQAQDNNVHRMVSRAEVHVRSSFASSFP